MHTRTPRLDVKNLPRGVVFVGNPDEMHDATKVKGTMLVMAPFALSSAARKSIRAARLSPDMRAVKALNDEGDRFRPPYIPTAIDACPLLAARTHISRAFAPNKYTAALVDDMAVGIGYLQKAVGVPALHRIEAQGPDFRPTGHTDTSVRGASVKINGRGMRIRVRNHKLRGAPMQDYLMPHDVIATWTGIAGDIENYPPLFHFHGEIEKSDAGSCPSGPFRAIYSVLVSPGTLALEKK